jgi:SAM-dependent methyltransferase
MERDTARRLSDLTTQFYARSAASFSATRQSPWKGWERLLETCGIDRQDDTRTLDVLDLACGNLRFERFLVEHVGHVRAWAYDNCDELVGQPPCPMSYTHLDLAEHPEQVSAPPCDLCVSFGFMHHLPTLAQRKALVSVLVKHARPDGWVAVSFWQFAHDPRLRAKARPVEGGEPEDFLLGWQDDAHAQRYCHSFEETEIDELAYSMRGYAREEARFSADGRSGDLNRYLILRRIG